jgi:hypothetical protein
MPLRKWQYDVTGLGEVNRTGQQKPCINCNLLPFDFHQFGIVTLMSSSVAESLPTYTHNLNSLETLASASFHHEYEKIRIYFNLRDSLIAGKIRMHSYCFIFNKQI